MNIHEEDYPYSIYKRPERDELLDAHNDIIAVFDPHTEPEIEHMIAAAPEMYKSLKEFMYAANPTRYLSRLLDDAYVKAAAILQQIDGEENNN